MNFRMNFPIIGHSYAQFQPTESQSFEWAYLKCTQQESLWTLIFQLDVEPWYNTQNENSK